MTQVYYNQFCDMNNKFQEASSVFIISAPSGAGKTSLVRQLCEDWNFIKPSISFTTRRKRPTEKEGIDYHFISKEEFKTRAEKGEFIEYQNVYGNFYGTSLKSVTTNITLGFDVLLEIDYKGMLDVKKKLPEATSIYIIPPSIEALKGRLEKRGENNLDEITARISSSKTELSFSKYADHTVTNEDFSEAVKQLKRIIIDKKLKSISLDKWVNSISGL